ncbi:MAG: acetylornithine deacetylase [Acetobacter sp.]
MSLQPSQNALDWISRLIAYPTVSSVSNLDLIEDVAGHFRGLGMDVALTRNDEGTKANLFATLPGRSDAYLNGLVLSGHSDVVPVVGQDWSSDPFQATLRDGRLYGRGACDMKGFLGVATALAEDFARRQPEHPVHYAFSFDEEPGCLGAPLMIRDLVARGYHPRACVVGEPTDMAPVTAHKASRVFECSVVGKSSHSSRPQDGVNAINYAARIIEFLRLLAESFRAEEGQDMAFDPPYSTVSVGTIEGGISSNTVAPSCFFTFEFRSLPNHSADAIEGAIRAHIDNEILPLMRAQDPQAGVTLRRRANVPALASRTCEALDVVKARLDTQTCECVSYGTEAGMFQGVGIDTLVCGPGSIVQAHKPDEYVTLEQLARCERFLRAIVT